MKLTNLMTYAFAAAALSSCVADFPDYEGGGEVAATRTLNVAIAGSSEQTRSRELSGTEALQTVTNVRIYCFKGDAANTDISTYTYCQPEGAGYFYMDSFRTSKETDLRDNNGNITGTDVSNPVWGDDANETNIERYGLDISEVDFDAGNYLFLAVGRDDIREGSEADAVFTVPAFTEGATTLAEAQLAMTASAASGNVPASIATAEVFSGISEFIDLTGNTGTKNNYATIAGGKSFKGSITLKRDVAGVLMEIDNLPTTVGGAKVYGVGIAPVGEYNTAVGLQNRTVSGAASTGTPTITFSDLAGLYEGGNLSADHDGGDVIINISPKTPERPNLAANGAFVVPQAERGYTLNLYGADGSVLASKTIKLKVVNDDESTTNVETFPLLANHFYRIYYNWTKPATDDVIIVIGNWQAEVNINIETETPKEEQQEEENNTEE